jgi:hypothetical protein
MLGLLALLMTLLVGSMVRPVVRIGGAVLPLETNGLVGHEMAEARVNGGRDGERNDDAYIICEYKGLRDGKGISGALTKGPQLGRDLLEAAETLRNSVRYRSPAFVSVFPGHSIQPQ